MIDTNLVTIPAEILTRLGPGTNTTIVVVTLVIAAIPSIGAWVVAIKTAGTVGKIETSTNSAAAAMLAKLDKSNEEILRMSQELATLKSERQSHALAAASAKRPRTRK